MIIIETKACPFCGLKSTMEVTDEQFKQLTDPNGPFIQDIFPDIYPADRELLISGTHPNCWDAMFGPDDEDEETE